jgi:nicotinamidase-related amidase
MNKTPRDFLIIVDMQIDFPTANDRRTIDNCIILINYAIKNNIIPVFLYYENYGKLVSKLQSLVDNLEREKKELWHIWKYENDGSCFFKDDVDKSNYSIDKIYVCGINLDACVEETYIGLQKWSQKVVVFPDACNVTIYNSRIDYEEYSKIILDKIRRSGKFLSNIVKFSSVTEIEKELQEA